MMPIDIKVTAVLNHNKPIPKRITGLTLTREFEYQARKYNTIGLVQLFCTISPLSNYYFLYFQT